MEDVRVDLMREIKALSGFEMRGPTKEGERRASEYLKKRMEEMGLETSVDRFQVNPHYYWVYFAHALVALLAGIATIWASGAHWLSWAMAGICLVVVISFWGDLTTKFHFIRNITHRHPSQNVLGRIPRKGAKHHIILSAHYDAAKVGTIVFNPDLDEKIAKFYKEKFDSTPNVMMPIILAMAGIIVVAVIRGIFHTGTWMWVVTGIIQGVSSLVLIIAALAFLDIGTGHYVPGASDNASGVAACMSVTEAILAEPLKALDLTLLAVGCEEAIMVGMVEFFKMHESELNPDNTYFINLESLGGGTIHCVTDEGFVRVHPYSEELVSIACGLKESGGFPEIGAYKIRLGSDAMVPMFRGYKAITLIALNQNNIVPHYHTDQDTPENIDLSTVGRGRDLALAMIRELDQRIAGPGHDL